MNTDDLEHALALVRRHLRDARHVADKLGYVDMEYDMSRIDGQLAHMEMRLPMKDAEET